MNKVCNHCFPQYYSPTSLRLWDVVGGYLCYSSYLPTCSNWIVEWIRSMITGSSLFPACLTPTCSIDTVRWHFHRRVLLGHMGVGHVQKTIPFEPTRWAHNSVILRLSLFFYLSKHERTKLTIIIDVLWFSHRHCFDWWLDTWLGDIRTNLSASKSCATASIATCIAQVLLFHESLWLRQCRFWWKNEAASPYKIVGLVGFGLPGSLTMSFDLLACTDRTEVHRVFFFHGMQSDIPLHYRFYRCYRCFLASFHPGWCGAKSVEGFPCPSPSPPLIAVAVVLVVVGVVAVAVVAAVVVVAAVKTSIPQSAAIVVVQSLFASTIAHASSFIEMACGIYVACAAHVFQSKFFAMLPGLYLV